MPKAGENCGELDADRAATHDDDVVRDGTKRVDLVGVVDVRIVKGNARVAGRT